MTSRAGSKTRIRLRKVDGGHASERSDHLATEEPLEIRLAAGGNTRTLAITMRTPGADFELAAGFLHGEGVLSDRRDARELRYCTDPALDAAQQYNVVTVELASTELPDLPGLDRARGSPERLRALRSDGDRVSATRRRPRPLRVPQLLG